MHLARSVLMQIVANNLRKGIATFHFMGKWTYIIYLSAYIYIYKQMCVRACVCVCMWWDNPGLDFSNLFNHEIYNEYLNVLQSFPNIGKMFHKTLGTHVAFYKHFFSLIFFIVSRLLFTDMTFLTLLILTILLQLKHMKGKERKEKKGNYQDY